MRNVMRMSTRHNFHRSVKSLLARRVGFLCSNPACRCPTSGPHTDPERAVGTGVAAHITAASANGPRFDSAISPEERRSAQNGIWLCQVHAKLVDDDVERYPVSALRKWKHDAEEEQRRKIEGRHHDIDPGVVSEIDRLIVAVQEKSTRPERLKEAIRQYVDQLINGITPESAAGVVSGLVEMIPLDTGFWLHPDDVAAEGLCRCDQASCVDRDDKAYCVFARSLPEWVINAGLYWKCYDELVQCPRCALRHKRGHIGKTGKCGSS